MRMRAVGSVALGLVLSLTAFEAGAKTDPKDNMLQRGAQDFRIHCAACHGLNAQGDGPVAPFLVRKPPDLTTLEARNEGHFPTDYVYWIIDGRGDVAAHGPREMPVWGERLGGPEKDESKTRKRILDIIAYLKTLQRGMPVKPTPR